MANTRSKSTKEEPTDKKKKDEKKDEKKEEEKKEGEEKKDDVEGEEPKKEHIRPLDADDIALLKTYVRIGRNVVRGFRVFFPLTFWLAHA